MKHHGQEYTSSISILHKIKLLSSWLEANKISDITSNKPTAWDKDGSY